MSQIADLPKAKYEMADCLLFYGHALVPGAFKPAGPYRLASELRLHGYDARCVDIAPLTRKYIDTVFKIIDKFVGPETLWVGISTTFLTHVFGFQIKRLSEDRTEYEADDSYLTQVLARCKARNPNVKFLVGGGFHVNLEKYGFYSITGYADKEILEFTKWCADSSYKPKMQRLGKVITGTEFAEFHSSKIHWEKHDIINPREALPIEVARGCIFRCKFCAFPLNGKTKGEWVKRAEVLKSEMLRNYEMFGTTQYMFADDTYNDSTDKIRMLNDEVFSKLPFQPDISGYIRLDLMERFRDQAEILVESGFKSMMIGVETNNNRSAKAIGKGLSFERQMEYLGELKQGLLKDTLVGSGFILGLPFDTEESFQQLKDFLLSSNNPLDEWLVRPLGLNPVNKSLHKSFFSEFDLEHEKWGYELLDQDNDEVISTFRMKWRVKSTGIDIDQATKWSDDINRLSEPLDKFRYASHQYARMSRLIPAEEVRHTSRVAINQKYNIKELESAWTRDYYKQLLS